MPFDLQRAHALLGRGRPPERIAPVAQRQPRFFKHRAETDGELPFTIVTTPQKPLVALAFGIFHLIHVARIAVMTNRLAFPKAFFQKLNRRKFVAAGQRNLRYRFRLSLVRFFFVNLHAFTLYNTQ